jgi:PAS domain S-box-containing protein
MAANQQLNESLRELRDLKAALDEHAIVAITDSRGKITYVNNKFCEIAKYSRTELIGQDHRLINSGHHSKEFMRGLWETISRGKVWRGEIRNRAKDGSYYWVDTTIVPHLNALEAPYQYVAIRVDVTERKRAEEEILRLSNQLEARVAERTAELELANKELEAFSYSVSHDLRAPLRAINGFAGIVLEDYGSGLPEEARNYLRRVRDGGRRMAQLIDDLLRFAQLSGQPLERQAVDNSDLVREIALELRAADHSREMEIRVGELPTSWADPALLKQVWINLLSNAVKYSRNRKPAVVEVGSQRLNGGVIFHVRDNGVGFDMQYASKLFGVFQRLHRPEEFEGTGVGLAIVQRVIHRHGGQVWAQAAPGQGATFYFTVKGENA